MASQHCRYLSDQQRFAHDSRPSTVHTSRWAWPASVRCSCLSRKQPALATNSSRWTDRFCAVFVISCNRVWHSRMQLYRTSAVAVKPASVRYNSMSLGRSLSYQYRWKLCDKSLKARTDAFILTINSATIADASRAEGADRCIHSNHKLCHHC
jgi:hypothetical protein